MSSEVAPQIRPEIRTIDGLAIRIARGERNPKLTAEALLLSPWHESLYAFEPTWARLARHATLLEAGHFLWEDAADEYAAEVTAWWDRH